MKKDSGFLGFPIEFYAEKLKGVTDSEDVEDSKRGGR